MRYEEERKREIISESLTLLAIYLQSNADIATIAAFVEMLTDLDEQIFREAMLQYGKDATKEMYGKMPMLGDIRKIYFEYEEKKIKEKNRKSKYLPDYNDPDVRLVAEKEDWEKLHPDIKKGMAERGQVPDWAE